MRVADIGTGPEPLTPARRARPRLSGELGDHFVQIGRHLGGAGPFFKIQVR